MTHAETPQQAAAVAIRHRGESLETCIIRKKDARNWGVPKGLIDPGDTAEETALNEAIEEAGIQGQLLGPPLGTYTYRKWETNLVVAVYVMQVFIEYSDWLEAPFRERRWVSLDEAKNLLLHHPVLRFVDRAFLHFADQAR
jgi:phosphohistidine phosphatase